MSDVRRTAAAVMMALGLMGALAGCHSERAGKKEAASAPAKEFAKPVPADADKKVAMLLPDFTALVTREGPTVVNIQAFSQDRPAQGNAAQGGNDPFDQFFRRLAPPNGKSSPQEDAVNYGSGFIISKDGFVLTNAHVIKGSSVIKVTLNNKRDFTAKLIGADEQSDVALLKIDAANLPVIEIGDPHALKVGEWVAAIGAPFGFDNTVTAGIVSAKDRNLPDENYTPFIQTDVAINPGNSGGPLFNLNGQVVGINSQIYSRSGGFMGISFAIPIDIAMNVAEQLKSTGKVTRGQLGVIIQEVTYDLAQSFHMDKPEGALIVKVLPGGPGAQANLQPGDIVLAVNGRAVESSSDLPMMIGQMQPGQAAKLTLWRAGKKIEVPVTLGELSAAVSASSGSLNGALSAPGQSSFSLNDIGLTLAPLPADALKGQGLENGVLVQQVAGRAKTAGLMAGDVLVGIGQSPVNDEASVRKALGDVAGSDVVPLFVMRRGQTVFLPLPLK